MSIQFSGVQNEARKQGQPCFDPGNKEQLEKNKKKIGRVQVRNVTSPNREHKCNRKDNSHNSSSLGEGRGALRLNYV